MGEFEIKGIIGEGGFGIVYRAWDELLSRWVALKEYMPSSLAWRTGSADVAVKSKRDQETFDIGLRSFVNEAHSLAQFDHPSLLKVYRFWEANGTAYMVMPVCEGLTLSDTLTRLGAQPDEAWLLWLLAPLTEALAVIHAEQLYHRDIAPDNIILSARDGRPILLDFGAARRVISDMAHTPTAIVKAGYAPLEQYGEVPGMEQGPWTDIYALAAVVHFAISGVKPPSALSRYANDSYVPLATRFADHYSDRFLKAIDNALRVKPDGRTRSIDAFRQDIGLAPIPVEYQSTLPAPLGDSTFGAGGLVGRPTGSFEHQTPVRRAATKPASRARATWKWGVFGALAIVLVAAAWLLWHQFMSVPPTPPVAEKGPVPLPLPHADVASAVLPVPPTPTPTPTPFSVTAEFDKVLRNQDPSFGVEAGAARGTLRIDHDDVDFHVKSARDGYAYVLVFGPDGSLELWFPNSKDGDNRIRAGVSKRLPTASWRMTAAEPVGQEQFLVIVSAEPRDYSEFGSVRDAGSYFLTLPTGDNATQIASAHRGPGPVLTGMPQCTATGCEAYGAARFNVEVVR
jgi:serine/threonine protein kinase